MADQERAPAATLLADVGAQVLASAIRPLRAGWTLQGRALTVRVPAGDNLAIHAALALVRPGEVLVIDGRGHSERALMGGIMCAQAKAAGVAGIVIDGAIRDVAELTAASLPVFARAVVPAGPFKRGGGSVGRAIECGGVAVTTGDWVIGDDDGLVCLRDADRETLFAKAHAKGALEAARMAAIARGDLRPAWLDDALAQAGAELDVAPRD